MTINWKLISYLMAFLAGIERGRDHDFLCLLLCMASFVSYWYIKHGTLSSDREEA